MKRIGICVLALIFTVGLCVPTFATVNQSSANLNVGLKEGKVHNRINSEKNIIDYEQGNSQSVKAKLEAQVKGILEDNDKGRFIVTLKSTMEPNYDNQIDHSEINSYIKSAQKFINLFIDQIKKDGIDVEIINKYDLLLCGVAVEGKYKEIKKLAGYSNVDGIAYCIKYQEPKINRTNIVNTKDLSSNELINLPMLNSKYKGAGKIVAVIDSGFDYKHPSMRVSDSTAVKIADKPAIESLKYNAQIDYGEYLSKKIPFAYNYADKNDQIKENSSTSHGMHVAGIIAANSENASPNGDVIKGVAPESQIFAMRVFGSGEGTSEDIYVKAMEDAVKLGADSINMSLGSPLGSINGSLNPVSETTRDALKAAERMGIVVAVAAGNEGAFGNGIAFPTVYAPDYGLVDSPSVAPVAFSVASCNNTLVSSKMLEVKGYNKHIGYAYGTGPMFDDPSSPMTNFAPLVYCGRGTKEDFKDIGELYNKVVLVERGENTFKEKVDNASKKGAKGVIVYNNETGGEELVKMTLGGNVIPAIFIRHSDGKYLKEKIEQHQTQGMDLGVRVGSKVSKTPNPNGGKLSKFSSWGLSVDGDLKPEILAPGGDIYSTINENSYVSMSGTSMATPHVAGAIALMSERADELNLSKADKYKFIKNMLMSTAEPISDDGAAVSPRGQGAGLMNIYKAAKSKVYLLGTSERASVMCGDINPNFSFNVTVVNTDNVEHKFKYSTDLVTDKVENGRYTLKSKALKKIEGTEVIVPANDKKTVTVSVDASDIDAAERDLQPKGYYLEGYTAFESLDGAENLSIPFVGFVGKWKELPAIEDSIYTMSKENREPIYYDGNGKRHDFTHFMTTVDGKNMVSGEYTDNNNVKKYSGDLIAFSPNADGRADELQFVATFIRNYKTFLLGVYKPEDVERKHPLHLASNYVGGLKNFNNPYDVLSARSYTNWDWAWDGGTEKEGRYDVVVTVGPEIAPNSSTIQIYSVVLDRTAPQLKNITYDQNSRKFKIGDIVEQGSGLKYVELSYDKNGETVVIPQSVDKEWIIPDALELENVTVKAEDFAFNLVAADAKSALSGVFPGVGVKYGKLMIEPAADNEYNTTPVYFVFTNQKGEITRHIYNGPVHKELRLPVGEYSVKVDHLTGYKFAGPLNVEVQEGEKEFKYVIKKDAGGGTNPGGGSGGGGGGAVTPGPSPNPSPVPVPGERPKDDGKKDNQNINFVDVPAEGWFSEAVKNMVKKGVLQGVSKERFAPENITTRAMVVTMLYRMEKEPTVSNKTVFKDVKDNMWYYSAILWAYENKIVKGIGTDIFAPDKGITREELVNIIAAYEKFKGKTVTAGNVDMSVFKDRASVSAWAEESVSWAVENKLLQGNAGFLNPKGKVTRAELAVIFDRKLTEDSKTAGK